jgi:hypothetical protein
MSHRLSRRTSIAAALAVPAMARAASPTMARAQTSGAPMRLRCHFADQDFAYRLVDNPTVPDFVSMLPLNLTISDFSTNEKIAHLPRRLDEGGLADFDDEAPGDLCYFRGWGNLAFFHDDYRYRGDLIRLGRIEGGVEPLSLRGEFPLRLDLID